MSTFLRKKSPVSCFFCQSTVSPPPTSPRSFLCPQCSCWNRFDQNGDIMSDDPAMHDESMNSTSFARRGSPRKDRFPSTFGSVTFCSTCQANQRLVISLLSSYLPPSEDDPGYARRLESFPAYRNSVYERYPQVCDDCAPLVEAEIKRKDEMARVNALGQWLAQTKGTDARRFDSSGSRLDRYKLERELWWWRARGVLWGVTLCGAIGLQAAGATGHLPPLITTNLAPVLPFFMLLSILWMAWHPTYASFRRAELQGRKVRVRGKHKYVTLQIITWCSRTLTASLVALAWYHPSMDYLSFRHPSRSPNGRIYLSTTLCIELLVLVRSIFVLRLHQSPAVRLLETAAPSTSTSTDPSRSRASTPLSFPSNFPANPPAAKSRNLPPEMLDTLSLSGTSGLQSAHQTSPVFGLPSLVRPSTSTFTITQETSHRTDHPPTDVDMDDDPDAMDWTPTSAIPTTLPLRPAAEAWVGKKNTAFKPSDQTTGLETLFERTNIAEKDSFALAPAPSAGTMWKGVWVVYGLLALLVGAGSMYVALRWAGRPITGPGQSMPVLLPLHDDGFMNADA